MKRIVGIALVLIFTSLTANAQNYVQLSIDFLSDIEAGKNTDAYLPKFKAIDKEAFLKEVDTDGEKLTFWINYYNGMIQHILKKEPGLYKDRGSFFGKEQVPFAGEMLSFDNMEHGVLRKGVSKLSKGYFENPFGSDWHEPYEVAETDWRIHFALNCGAKDCPPIRVYKSETIYDQLNASAKQYMEAQVQYDASGEEVRVPALMSWFSADFGGSDGVMNILHEYNQVPRGQNPDIDYKDYDWTLALGTFYKN
jgi:hypothetical protein